MAGKDEEQAHKDFGAIGNLRYKEIKYLDEKIPALREINNEICKKLPNSLTSDAGCAATHDAMIEAATHRLSTPANAKNGEKIKGK